jgi:beta-ribofuranosylaminobenzene 5'-phosphate synthase
MNAVIPAERTVSVTTYGRLHLGFFNLSRETQRQFGSVGVAIDAFQTSLSLSQGPQQQTLDPWASAILQRHLAVCEIHAELNVAIQQAVPRHGGLGSGTQMALALGAAVNSLFDRPVAASEIAAIHQRGARSGIGIATFEHGGLVVDGGRGSQTIVPPMLARHAFPADWHFLLMMDHSRDGLHGQGEKTAFKQLAPQSLAATQSIQQQLLSQGLPALIEQDFAAFSQFIGALQAYNAEYFAPAQGGPYASQAVARILDTLEQQGYAGVGQTSWGPTGFVLLPSRAEAVAMQMQLLNEYVAQTTLSFLVTAAVNQPAHIHIED